MCVFFFLLSLHTLRGVGADVVYVDEAAFAHPALVHQIILPLFEMRKTALICISSPGGENNFYTQLMRIKHPVTGVHPLLLLLLLLKFVRIAFDAAL